MINNIILSIIRQRYKNYLKNNGIFLLETYAKEKININKIYLACGKILKKAHNFYIKNGFEQINKID